jgi:8-oxo-dGTP diphosphatase
MNFPICTVDVVLLTLQDECLKVALLRRDKEPFKDALALPGGYVHTNEDANAKQAAIRMLRSKAQTEVPYLEQLATFSGTDRDPRGWSISVIYYALVSFDFFSESTRNNIQLANVDKLPKLPFDHKAIINTAVNRLRSKSQYSSLPCYLAGETFTLPQLQRVYEALMGEQLNKVSFRRKMTEMDMLTPVEGQFEATGAHRPAQLYQLKEEFKQELQLLDRGL